MKQRLLCNMCNILMACRLDNIFKPNKLAKHTNAVKKRRQLDHLPNPAPKTDLLINPANLVLNS